MYDPQVVPPSTIRGRIVVRLDGAGVYETWADGANRGYGRGSLESVRRSARAVTESPISASSAIAWTAVPITSGRWGAGGTGERGAEGMPRG